jgi:hypothetical protein
VRDHDSLALHHCFAYGGQLTQLGVVIAANRFDACDALEVGDCRGAGDVPRVEDQIDP